MRASFKKNDALVVFKLVNSNLRDSATFILTERSWSMQITQ